MNHKSSRFCSNFLSGLALAALAPFASTASTASTAMASEVVPGFQGGAHFQAQTKRGEVTATCGLERPEVRHIACAERTFSGSRRQYFVGPKDVDADEVRLEVVNDDGQLRARERSYSPALGRTKRRINLWNSNLFQWPLLSPGTNHVEYIFLKDEEPVSQGTFEVVVEKLEDRICRPRSLDFPTDRRCNESVVCNEYFADPTNCAEEPEPSPEPNPEPQPE